MTMLIEHEAIRANSTDPAQASLKDDLEQINEIVVGNNSYTKHFASNAPIWSLYLKETEATDKELAALWNTGLDSLLIFVRISSFQSSPAADAL